MTAKRTLLAVVCAGVLGAGDVLAQQPLFGGRTTTVTGQVGQLPTRPTVPPPTGSPGSVLPLIPPRTDAPRPLLPAQATQPLYPTETVATDVLTAPQGGIPEAYQTVPTVPGAVYSPWVGAAPAGALGGHGPVTYEGYIRTGPSLNIGGGELSAILDHGWMTAGGGRTLFFNATNDAAWVLDLGVSFTRNFGPRLGRLTSVDPTSFRGNGAELDPTIPAAQQTPVLPPDGLTIPVGIRAVRRTSLNFGIGRDWWMYGPGTVGETAGWGNWRGGFDIGGRWGTSSIDFEPLDDPGGLRHRQAVYHGVYVGSTLNWERQFGAVILQAGIRAEWGYDWMNLLPPQMSNLHSLNCLMMFGMRY